MINQLKANQEKGKAPLGEGPVSLVGLRLPLGTARGPSPVPPWLGVAHGMPCGTIIIIIIAPPGLQAAPPGSQLACFHCQNTLRYA